MSQQKSGRKWFAALADSLKLQLRGRHDREEKLCLRGTLIITFYSSVPKTDVLSKNGAKFTKIASIASVVSSKQQNLLYNAPWYLEKRLNSSIE